MTAPLLYQPDNLYWRSRKPALLIVKLFAILVLASSQLWADEEQSQNPSTAEPQVIPPENPVKIVTLAEVYQNIERSAPARTLSLNQAKIAAEINARIVGIEIETGDSVSVGQTLVTLDCSDYDRARAESSARLDANKSRLRLAEQQLDRARQLVQSKSMSDDALDRSQSEYDSALAEISAQQAMLARAENQAARCIVKAPFGGVISQRVAQVGEFTAPGSVLVEIIDVANVELSVQLPDTHAQDPATLSDSVFVYNTISYPVILRTILPLVDEVTHSREARFRFVSTPALVGSVGRLKWQASRSALPARLISQRNGQFGVLIVDGEFARFVPIDGAQEGRPAIVDLDPATRVITDGRHGLEDGDTITIQQ